MQNVRSGEFSGTSQVWYLQVCHVVVLSQFAYIQIFYTLKNISIREEIAHSDLGIIQSIFDPVFVNQTDWLSLTSSNVLQQNLEILSVAISEVKIELGQRALCFYLKWNKKKISLLSLQFSFFSLTPGGGPYVSLLWHVSSSINTSLTTHHLG